jgi:LysM repeat protein
VRLSPTHGIVAALLAAASAVARPAGAQSLRGSPESVERMYQEAQREQLQFSETARDVHAVAASGALVRLTAGRDLTLRNVAFPYVTPATQAFVERLGRQHRTACGKPLMITSAARPTTRQPANSVAQSVHPTGMAVDLRKPTGRCLRWLRETLLELEDAGVIEATEERRPPHFHVAVFPTSYTRYAAVHGTPTTEPERAVATTTAAGAASKAPSEARTRRGARVSTRVAKATARPDRRYRVREGDTLWDIARAHRLSVEQLLAANRMTKPVIRPGQRLVLPAPSARLAAGQDALGQ